jgi:1-aminocyclopropane-1-carboxylate deaminase/D-cysteine desulfhydrase-like pyridoxal-dependent ACC family enzyme
MSAFDAARSNLARLPTVDLGQLVSPVHTLDRLREALGGGPRLLIKRDDLIGFGLGGNKVRKLAVVAARACAEGADTLVTTGGVQSNHARVTAAVAARLGMKCVLVLNGVPQAVPTGNARLCTLLGAEVHYVASREQRSAAMGAVVEHLADQGRRPFMIPLGASTPLGAMGCARAVEELLSQVSPPDVIVHSTSSGGTQAGFVFGCALHRLATRVVGVSADEPAAGITAHVRGVIGPMADMVGAPRDLVADCPIEVDDGFVGIGYGVPSPASEEATRLLATTEGIVLDPTYTAKAMAGLIDDVRRGAFAPDQTVLFWHTGGLPGFFA